MTLISAGYFCTDLAITTTHFNEHGIEPLVHAVLCVAYFVWSSLTGNLQWIAARLLMFELSTPFVHMRWFLHSLNVQHTRLYTINGLAMMGAFFACRVLLGTRIVITFLDAMSKFMFPKRFPGHKAINRATAWTLSVMGVSIQGLNLFWFYKMCRGAASRFSPSRAGSRANSRPSSRANSRPSSRPASTSGGSPERS